MIESVQVFLIMPFQSITSHNLPKLESVFIPIRTFELQFKKTKNGVLVTDIIQYQLPFGKLGVFLEKKIVKKRIHDIFNYRREILQNLFT